MLILELAPMAGITNAAYRQLCREQAQARRRVGLFVCEMITSRGLVERDPKTLSMLQFDPGETVRLVQLYGVDPLIMAQATEILCERVRRWTRRPNFGCPVPKVTRKGGGAALPYKRDRLRMILEATVRAAQPYGVPVTIKTRIGIDHDHQTFLDAGRIAEQSGCAAIALHGRTASRPIRARGLVGDRCPERACRHSGARQRRHLGGVGRAADDHLRPAPTAWSSAAAASAGPGCFVILPTRSPGGDPHPAGSSVR
jgi:tRNA-dihydrouridine synthase